MRTPHLRNTSSDRCVRTTSLAYQASWFPGRSRGRRPHLPGATFAGANLRPSHESVAPFPSLARRATVPRGTCPAVLWCAGSDGDQRAWAVSPRPFCTVRGVLFAISGGAEPLGILFCDPSVAADKQHGGGSHPRLVREIECHVVHIPGPESARPLASLPPLRTPASPTTRHGR